MRWPSRVTRAPRPAASAGTECGSKRQPGRLRIVGGVYRGRKLPVPDQPGLRPTADRVRETLFNWLAPIMPGARCLDCFAGSGALGLEAASRGAAEVVMLERAEPVVRQLLANVSALGADQAQVVRGDALRWLEGQGRPFDIVFLDPPFADVLLAPTCALLARNGWVRDGSRVYLETLAKPGLPSLPQGWRLVREQRAGQVAYGLALVERTGTTPGTTSDAPSRPPSGDAPTDRRRLDQWQRAGFQVQSILATPEPHLPQYTVFVLQSATHSTGTAAGYEPSTSSRTAAVR